MATIKDVAELAQVSVATVSRVLNEEDNVRPETKQKVRDAIKMLNYSPNLLGRNLRRSHTNNILVLLPTISNPFYSTVIKGIKSKAKDAGYHIMIGITEAEEETEKALVKMLTTRLVDGIILCAPQVSAKRLTKVAKEYPIVQCSEYIEGSSTSRVSIDNFQAAYDATKYLIELGHKHIILLSNKDGYTSARLREEGFRRALQDYSISPSEHAVQYTNYSYRGGRSACKKLLALEERPTAIFAIADSIAVGVIKELIDEGIKVGEEIDVIGFDDTTITKIYHPTITTIAQPRFEMGRAAMELLLNKIEDIDSPGNNLVLPHELILRESTKKL